MHNAKLTIQNGKREKSLIWETGELKYSDSPNWVFGISKSKFSHELLPLLPTRCH